MDPLRFLINNDNVIQSKDIKEFTGISILNKATLINDWDKFTTKANFTIFLGNTNIK